MSTNRTDPRNKTNVPAVITNGTEPGPTDGGMGSGSVADPADDVDTTGPHTDQGTGGLAPRPPVKHDPRVEPDLPATTEGDDLRTPADESTDPFAPVTH